MTYVTPLSIGCSPIADMYMYIFSVDLNSLPNNLHPLRLEFARVQSLNFLFLPYQPSGHKLIHFYKINYHLFTDGSKDLPPVEAIA